MWIYDNYINVWFLLSFVWIYCKRINTSAQKWLWWVGTLAVSSEVGGQGSEVRGRGRGSGGGRRSGGGRGGFEGQEWAAVLLPTFALAQYCTVLYSHSSLCLDMLSYSGPGRFSSVRHRQESFCLFLTTWSFLFTRPATCEMCVHRVSISCFYI